MESPCMDGIGTGYTQKNSGNVQSQKSALKGYRFAVAGLTGALLCVNTGISAFAAQGRGACPEDESNLSRISGDIPSAAESGIWWGRGSDGADSEDPEGGDDDQKSVTYWDEEKILDRWDLDPDDFPSDRDNDRPEIPEEYLSYFQEAASEAVQWYAGQTPPGTDLSKYSARADAIREAAAKKATKALRKESSRLVDMTRNLLASSGSLSGQELVSALQENLYSRPVRTHSYAYLNNGIGPDGGQGSLMTAGKPRKDRTNGSSSVSWFLSDTDQGSRQNEEEDPSKDASEDFSDDNKSSDNSSTPKESSADRDGSKETDPEHVRDQDFLPAQQSRVMSPAFHYLMTPPFAYDTGPEAYLVKEDNTMPLPVGIYPYAGTYTAETPSDHAAAAEEYQEEDGHSPGEQNEDRHSEEKDDFEDKKHQEETFLPLRYYKDRTGSMEFFGQRRTVFIGDSRTVGMEMSCGGMPEEYWSSKTAMGYSWMVNSGIPNVENLIGPDTDVVILMGVNDLGNVYQYVDYINMKAAEWKKLGARTFFVSVTPVDDRRSPNAKNARIESFNAYAIENFQDVYYIDAYNRIRYSYGSPDGIHYDSATYREIYRIIEFSLYQGWYEQDGLWFYFDRGRPLTGWQYLDGQWQYMDGYGVRWIRDGRVGDRICIPMPDFKMTGEEMFCPAF